MKHKIPNILTGLRIVLAFIFLFLYLSDSFQLRLLGILIFGIAAITDFFDGYLARTLKASSSFGIFWDPLADKFLTISGFITLPLLFPKYFPIWAIALILIRDVFITGFRMWTDKKGAMIETRYLAKAKTVFQMVFLYLALFFGAFRNLDTPLFEFSHWMFRSYTLTTLLYIVTFLTVYTGFDYLIKNKQFFKK